MTHEYKVIRFCIECGNQHDTMIENRLTGDFERIDKCINCLLSKCSFSFQLSPYLSLEDVRLMTHDEMQTELRKTVIEVLQREYGSEKDKLLKINQPSTVEGISDEFHQRVLGEANKRFKFFADGSVEIREKSEDS